MKTIERARLADNIDKANELTSKAIALCRLCRVQLGGEMPESEQSEFIWVATTIERIRDLIAEAEELDTNVEFGMALHFARAQAELLHTDSAFIGAGKQHLCDEVMVNALWSLTDDLERAHTLINA